MNIERSKSQFLRIKISVGGIEMVSLQFPATSIENLENLMAHDLLSKIQSIPIDLDKIKNAAINSNYSPQNLIEIEANSREIKVWLE